MLSELLARLDAGVRPMVTGLPADVAARVYSRGRKVLLSRMACEQPKRYSVPVALERALWGIVHRGPLMWGAGVDKEGALYHVSSRTGAAGHMVGTVTANAREGNVVEGIHAPFVPLPRSYAAVNNLGLPNPGDIIVSRRVSLFERDGCPVWVSVMVSPDLRGAERLEGLVDGMRMYERAGADVIELNMSCPNTGEDFADHDDVLKYVGERFVRESKVPVVVKESADLPQAGVPRVCDVLFEFGYAGINGVNTSRAYRECLERVDERERELFAGFTRRFKGGVSGRPLREVSLAFCARAMEYVKAGPPSWEFHVIRTGGIESGVDLVESDRVGVSMNQWVTGYWERFSREGYQAYKRVHGEYGGLKNGG